MKNRLFFFIFNAFLFYLSAQPVDGTRLSINDYVFKDDHNRKVHLSDFKGKVVILDCWASWCQPCIASFPTTESILQKNEGQPLVLVTINVDKNKSQWKPALRKYHVPGIHLYAKSKHPIHKALGIQQLPRYIILDKKGKIYSLTAKSPYEEQEAIQILMNE